MKKAKVQLWQSPRGYATVEDGATKGATFGQNLWWPDGSLVKRADFTNAGAPVQQGTPSQTLWSLVLQIPATVKALAAATGSGFYNSSGVFRDVAADEVTYDPTTSGLSSTDVQGAIDEIAARPASQGRFPLVTGEVPPVLMYADSGELIYYEVE